MIERRLSHFLILLRLSHFLFPAPQMLTPTMEEEAEEEEAEEEAEEEVAVGQGQGEDSADPKGGQLEAGERRKARMRGSEQHATG